MHGTRKYGLAVLVLALALGACETQPEQQDVAGTAEEMAPPAGPDAGTPPDDSMGATGEAMMSSFQPVNESGITGEVRIEPAGNQTRIVASLMGVQTQGTLQGHIHSGTCEA